MRIELTSEMENIINQQIANGYRSPEDVIKASLKLLQKHNEEKLEALRAELLPAIESLRRGEGTPLDIEAIKAEGRRRFEERQHKF